jgi:hypothetical protein
MRFVCLLFLLQACGEGGAMSDEDCGVWSPCCNWACDPIVDQNWGCDMECDTATPLDDLPGDCVAQNGECVWAE